MSLTWGAGSLGKVIYSSAHVRVVSLTWDAGSLGKVIYSYAHVGVSVFDLGCR